MLLDKICYKLAEKELTTPKSEGYRRREFKYNEKHGLNVYQDGVLVAYDILKATALIKKQQILWTGIGVPAAVIVAKICSDLTD